LKKKTDKVENIRQMKDIEILAEYFTLGPGVEMHEIYKYSFEICQKLDKYVRKI
jgi:hypothetical protein